MSKASKEALTFALLNLAYKACTECLEKTPTQIEFIRSYGELITEIWPEPKQEVQKPLRLENVIVSGMVREADYDADTNNIEDYETKRYTNTPLVDIVHRYIEAYNVSCTGIIDALPELEVGMTFAVKVGNLAKGYLVVEELRFDK